MQTLIGKGTTISGDVMVEGDVRLDGRIVGEVRASGLLVVSDGGSIEAKTINAQRAEIAGNVNGDLTAPQGVTLGSRAHFEGDLVTASLTIEAGAFFHGRSDMKSHGVPPEATLRTGKR